MGSISYISYAIIYIRYIVDLNFRLGGITYELNHYKNG